MFNSGGKQALYPVLQHYTGCKISSIFLDGEYLAFVTFLGEKGILTEDESGDWLVKIGEEVVYRIEGDIFNALVNPDKKNTLEDYVEILNRLCRKPNVSYRSKVLLGNIIKFLEEFILVSDFIPKKKIRIGSFEVFNLNGGKIINSLN
jgi:hypothetical protein